MGNAGLSEAVVAERAETEGPERPRSARLKVWFGRRTETQKPTEERPEREAEVASPIGYRTLSPKLAPMLTGIGGALALMGGLGAWVRESQVVSEGLAPESIGTVMGYTSDYGRLIAALGAVAAVSSFAWFMGRLWPKIVPVAASAAVIALTVWRLPIVSRSIDALAADAAEGPRLEFVSYHVGLGWGAWCLVLACVLVGLGIASGILREIDVRKGVPQ